MNRFKAVKAAIISVLLAALLLLPLAACAKGPAFYRASYFDLFDTATVINGWASDRSAFDDGVAELYACLKKYNRLFDIYNDYDGINNLKTVNDNAGGSPVTVDSEIIDLLSFAVEMHGLTDGTVNVCMGAVLSLWHAHRTADDNTLPGLNELSYASGHTDISCLEIDRAASTVRLTDSEASVDVGAVAKGFAADLALKTLEGTEIISAVINLGGNIVTYGEKPDGTPWSVGIQSPGTEASLPAVKANGISVVTSGDYQRFYTVDGVEYNHIIAPGTLFPAVVFSQVTVMAESSALSDALSTALFILDYEKGAALADRLGVAVIWVAKDKTVIMNDAARTLAGE